LNAWPPGTESRPVEELYHVAQDPAECVNVAADPEYLEIKKRLSVQLETWMNDTDDFVASGVVPSRPEEPGWGPWEG